MSSPRLTEPMFGLYQSGASVERQEAEGYRPRADLPPWPIGDGIDWYADPFDDYNWRWHLQQWSVMDAYIAAYFATGASLAKCVPMVVSWVAWYATTDDATRTFADGGLGARAKRIALLIDAHRAGLLDLSVAEASMLRRLARYHAEHLQGSDAIPRHNHGIHSVAGLYLLAQICCDEPWSDSAQETAVAAFRELVMQQFTEEGIHREHSPSYHYYAHRVLDTSYVRRRAGTPEIDRRLERAASHTGWLTLPNRETAPIGDSRGRNHPLSDTGGSELGGHAVAPFWRSGYGIVRSLPDVAPEEASMLFFMGARHSRAHKHDDDLSFTLFEFGADVLIDPGMCHYDASPERYYLISRPAHNTVGLADDAHSKRAMTDYGSALERPRLVDGCFELEGEVAWPTHRHHRTLIYRPREFLAVHDRLRSTEERRFASRLHLAPSIEVTVSGSVARLSGAPRPATIEFLGPAGLTAARGETEPLKGWHSPAYSTVVPTTTIEAEVTAKELTVGWLINLGDVAPDAARRAFARSSKAAAQLPDLLGAG